METSEGVDRKDMQGVALGKFYPDGYICIKDPFKPGCGPECLSLDPSVTLTSTTYISNSTRLHQV
jgi:hypothetical protein